MYFWAPWKEFLRCGHYDKTIRESLQECARIDLRPPKKEEEEKARAHIMANMNSGK